MPGLTREIDQLRPFANGTRCPLCEDRTRGARPHRSLARLAFRRRLTVAERGVGQTGGAAAHGTRLPGP